MQTRIFLCASLFLIFLGGCQKDQRASELESICKADIASAQKLIDLQFSQSEIDSLFEDVNDNLSSYHNLRDWQLKNAVAPALHFRPLLPPHSEIMTVEKSQPVRPSQLG